MSHRLHVALILDGQVRFHSTSWGGESIATELTLGPERFRKWLEQQLRIWPDGANSLGVIPDEFVAADYDRSLLKVYDTLGLLHQAEEAKRLVPHLSELIEHLRGLTPPIEAAFLTLLRELWPGWEIIVADAPSPQFDWGHLRHAPAPEVWAALKALPEPQGAEEVKARLTAGLRELKDRQLSTSWYER